MSTWQEERRKNDAAASEQARADRAAAADEARKNREHSAQLAREERKARKEEKREDKQQQRREKAARRQARAARREKTFKPGHVYRKGTLALVAASALASLPAQIMHFVAISLVLLPLPFAIEGAAWVMAAGVAYADERKLAAWVRWLLRGLSLSAAGFAAFINYGYGISIAPAAGYGLAAVSLLGPLFFEVRQWVTTLSEATSDPKKRAEEKSRDRHEKRRRRHHKDVAKVADRLMSAAPFGTLKDEDAWARAWEIVHGTTEVGMTPRLHAYAVRSGAELVKAQQPVPVDDKTIRQRILAFFSGDSGHRVATLEGPGKAPKWVLPTAPGSVQRTRIDHLLRPAGNGSQRATQGRESSQVSSHLSPSSGKGEKARPKPVPPRRRKGDSTPFSTVAKKQLAHDAKSRLTKVNGSH